MGLIKGLVLLPVAPVRGVMWVSERIAEEVERKEFSPAAAVQKLEDIAERRRRGELDEQEATRLEEELIAQQLTRAEGSLHG